MSDQFLAISGLQHFAYCPRQWALIHIEQQWAESFFTADGQAFHQKAHDSEQRERRGDLLILRGLPVSSQKLGVSGICDVVEFRRSEGGVPLFGEEGLWQPAPVEYKRGQPKEHNADALQLCCQAMCLEEMLLCTILRGSLFYGQTRRRQGVEFTDSLRQEVTGMLAQMRSLYDRGRTPRAKPDKRCAACSLKARCLPELERRPKVSTYLQEALNDPCENC
ncbi:MAG: CRISPR-associated protein Cas4 [Hominenteromicrobium sp.]